MQFGKLLGSLFNLSKEQRTDYSIALFYSPSEISKFISGKRLPPLQRAEGFIVGTAEFFADAFWRKGITNSLRKIFPAVMVIQSKEMLITFLQQALYSAYAESMEAKNSGLSITCKNHVFIQGREKILNHVLLSLSEAMRTRGGAKIMMTLPFFLTFMSDELIPARPMKEENKIHITVVINPDSTSDLIDLPMFTKLISFWDNLKQTFIVDTALDESQTPHPFFFVKGKSLLTVIENMPDSPVGNLIDDPEYLLKFGIHCSHRLKHRINYRRSDFTEDSALTNELLSKFKHAEAIFSFANNGLLLTRQQLERVSGMQVQKQLLLEIQQMLWEMPVPILISWESVASFQSDRSFWVPFIGRIQLDLEEALRYLQQFIALVTAEKRAGQAFFTQRNFPQMTIVLFKNEMLVLCPASGGQEEMMFLFPKAVCPQVVDQLNHLIFHEASLMEEHILNDFFLTMQASQR